MKPDISVLDEACRQHHAAGKTRATLRIKGFSRSEIIGRWNAVTKGMAAPRVKVARGGPDPDEDGLDRLIRKGKLRGDRRAMAEHYRRVARLVLTEGGGIKSCLDQTPGGGNRGGLPVGGVAFEATAAKRELFVMRHQVLRGQRDILTAMDGVLVTGQTLLALAGGAGKGGRASELYVALCIGLDMLIAHAKGEVQNAA